MPYKFSNLEAPIFVTKKQAEQENFNHALTGLAIGFAAGIVVGAAITALATPKSGKEARCAIKDAADETVDEVKGKTCCVKEKIKAKIEAKKSCGCQEDETVDFAEISLEPQDKEVTEDVESPAQETKTDEDNTQEA